MKRSVAINKLRELFGKSLGYRIDNQAPTREERDAAKNELKTAVEERNRLKEQKDARGRAILAADPEYQGLLAAHRTAGERVDKLGSISRRYKITVGVCSDMFFYHKAEGDSWEEVIDKLKTEKSKTTI